MRRSSPLGTSGLLWLALSLGVGAARAEPPAESAVAPAPESAEAVASDVQQRADAWVAQAKELFRKGEYRQALPWVERAYVSTGSARYLFNLGVLHHKLSECVPARENFELYLRKDPSGDGRAQALEALEELRVQCPSDEVSRVTPSVRPVSSPAPNGLAPAPGTSAQAPRLQPDPGPSERGLAPGSGALLLLGIGAAAGIGALISLAAQGYAQSEIDQLGSRAARETGVWDALEVRRRDLAANARLYRGLSVGFGLAGAAFVGAGMTVWILETRDGPSRRPVVAGVAYRGAF